MGKDGMRKPVLGIFEASVWVGVMLVGGMGMGMGMGKNDMGGNEGDQGEIGKKKGKWGIISTGEGWKGVLGRAVRGMMGVGVERDATGVGSDDADASGKEEWQAGSFAGVECCGVDAGALHEGEAGDVEARVKAAVGRLVRKAKGEVRVVVLVRICIFEICAFFIIFFAFCKRGIGTFIGSRDISEDGLRVR